MKKLIILIVLIQFFNHGKGQTKNDLDFILLNKQDTIYCVITDISRNGGIVYKIEYYDLQKQKQIIEGRETINVLSMRVAGRTMDYIPLKASKPDSYQRHIERKIDGKIKIYDHIRLIAKTDGKGNRQLYSVVGSGSVIYTIKLDDGSYYKIKSSNIKKVIVPHLMKCREFKNSFKEEISKSNIEEAVLTYNEVCN